MSSTSAPNRRSFVGRGAAVAAVPAVAALAGAALAEPASAGTLPDYAPIPPSVLGPAVNAQGYYGVVLFDAPRPSDTTFSAPSTRSCRPTTCPGR